MIKYNDSLVTIFFLGFEDVLCNMMVRRKKTSCKFYAWTNKGILVELVGHGYDAASDECII